MEFYMAWFGIEIPKDIQENIASNQKIIESGGHSFDVIHDINFLGTDKEATIAKDRLFLQMATEKPDSAFLDCDVTINTLTDVCEVGKPYFSIVGGNPHPGYFIVNKCCTFFINLTEELLRLKIQRVYGLLNKVLRDKPVYDIPDTDFSHEMKTYNKYYSVIVNKENFNANIVMRTSKAATKDKL